MDVQFCRKTLAGNLEHARRHLRRFRISKNKGIPNSGGRPNRAKEGSNRVNKLKKPGYELLDLRQWR
jgi:hypothetical protein